MTATAKKMLSVFMASVLVFTLSPTVAFGGNEAALQTSSTGEKADGADTFVVNDTMLPEVVEEDGPQDDDVVVDDAAVVEEEDEESDDSAGVKKDNEADEQDELKNDSENAVAELTTQNATQVGASKWDYEPSDETFILECKPCSYEEDGEAKTGVAITGIAGSKTEDNVEISIPAKIEHDGATYDVVSIGLDNSFSWGRSGRKGISKVTIPSSVKFVEAIKFSSVRSEVRFESGSSITELYTGIFQQSPGSYVALPDSLVTVSAEMFNESDITSITLPSTVRQIDRAAFQSTGQLATVTLNEGLQTIGIEAFAPYQREQHDIGTGNIPKFTSITIPASVTTIGDRAFYKNNNLTSVDFASGSNLNTIGDYAFNGTGLTSVSIPDSVTSIGFAAFSGRNSNRGIDSDDYGSNTDTERGSYTLTSVTFGSNSQLTTLGARAFARQPITSVVLPSGLTSLGYDKSDYKFDSNGNMFFFGGTNTTDDHYKNSSLIKMGAFAGCAQLESITWPQNSGFTTVGGFNDCTSLTAEAVNSLPSSVTTIDDYAFYNCTSMDDVYVPATVATIGKGAFSKPNNVTSTNKTFTLQNKNTELEGWTAADPTTGPWPLGCGYTIRYPKDVGEDDTYSIIAYRNAVQAYENAQGYSDDNKTKFVAVTEADYQVTGTVPEGATVTLYADSTAYTPELDANSSFTKRVESGKLVGAVVSLNGYADYRISPKDGSNLGVIDADWTFTVSESDMTPISELGALHVTGAGDYRANCNVAVIDNATGRVVSQGSALRASQAPADESPIYEIMEIRAGNYTVVAWQQNDYFSRISGIGDFAAMGFSSPGDFAQATVTVEAGKTAEVTLNVPVLDTSKISGVLVTGSVTIADYYAIPEVPFVATVSYDMTTGQSVDTVQVRIPEGIEPLVAATTAKEYFYAAAGVGASSWDPTSRILTIGNLEAADRQSGKISLSLEATTDGIHSISASVVSNGMTAPLGADTVNCQAIRLVVPEGTLTNSTFTVHVYAKPNSTATLKIGDTVLDATCKTNLVGHGKATIAIPKEEITASQYYQVTAAIPATNAGEEDLSDTAIVQYLSFLDDIPIEPTIYDFWFESAGQKVLLSEKGEDRSGGFYTVATSQHRTIFSTKWPFTASIDSLQPLEEEVTLYLGMLDNSVRSFPLYLSDTEDLASGAKRYTYSAIVELDLDGKDDWRADELPCRFDVLPDLLWKDITVQPYLTDANMNALSAAINQDAQAAYDKGAEAVEAWVKTLDEGQKKVLTGEALYCNEFNAFISENDARRNFKLPDTDTYDYAFGVFNNSFRHTTWDPEGIVWNTLTEDKQKELAEFEDEIALAYDALAIAMGNSQPMYEYASFDAYLEAEYGISNSDEDPSQLTGDGYAVFYDKADNIQWPDATNEIKLENGQIIYPDPQTSTSTWYAVDRSIMDDIGKLSTASAGGDDEGALTTAGASDPKGGATGGWGAIKQFGKSLFSGNAEHGDIDTALGTSLDISGLAADVFTDPAKYAGGKGALSVVGFFAAAKSIIDSSASHSIIESELTERKDELQRLNDMIKYYETHNVLNASECVQAMMEETQYLDAYIDDLVWAERITWCSNLFGGVSGSLGAVSGTSAAALGALSVSFPAVAPEAGAAALFCAGVSTSCAITSIMTTAATAAVGSLLLPDIGNKKSALRTMRYKRERICKDMKSSDMKGTDPFAALHYAKKTAIDPSGWTYEAVQDNRLEDVVATIYQRINGEWVKWDAAAYDQENPQNTTTAGLFAWDVPEGDWRVLFQKAGYLDKWSDIMHVLPAWVNVAINMLRADPPVGTNADANVDDLDAPYVDITFDQLMKAADGFMPTVTVDGAAVTSAYWVNVVTGTDENDAETALSRVLRVPLAGLIEPGDTVTVTVDDAYSYAGVQMAEPYTTTVTIPDNATYYYVAPDEVASYTKGSNEALAFTFKRTSYDERTFPRFQGILVDGAEVDASNYTATVGSVVVTLKAAYLETLAEGDHTLTAQFADGSATADFKVAAADADAAAAATKSPQTRSAPPPRATAPPR